MFIYEKVKKVSSSEIGKLKSPAKQQNGVERGCCQQKDR